MPLRPTAAAICLQAKLMELITVASSVSMWPWRSCCKAGDEIGANWREMQNGSRRQNWRAQHRVRQDGITQVELLCVLALVLGFQLRKVARVGRQMQAAGVEE
jgi:hypothetical protein